MDATNGTWMALCALAFVLGMKHGFDADHLATIDGLTRCNARANPRLSRFAGTLFSLGHGAVVVAVVAIAGSLATDWRAPAWLEVSGATVSIIFLFGLGFVNLRAVLHADPRAVVAPKGIRARLLGKYLDVHRAWAVALIGALFAISFDTVSQTVLLSLAAERFGGILHALFIAGLFVLGMLAVDGANGIWISRLIRRADRTAVVASRIMALAVVAISFAVGLLAATRLLFPSVQAWAEGRELVFGTIAIAVTFAAFAAAMTVSSRRNSAGACRARQDSQRG